MTAPATVRLTETRAEVRAIIEELRREVALHAARTSGATGPDAVLALAALRHLAADLALALSEFRLVTAAHHG